MEILVNKNPSFGDESIQEYQPVIADSINNLVNNIN